jgi:hypothetical protein
MVGLEDPQTMLKGEMGFNKFVARPLWQKFNALFGNEF